LFSHRGNSGEIKGGVEAAMLPLDTTGSGEAVRLDDYQVGENR